MKNQKRRWEFKKKLVVKYGEIMGGNGNGFEIDDNELICCITLPNTNSSPLKIGGWKTILSFSETLFSGAKMLVYHFGYVSLAMGGGGVMLQTQMFQTHLYLGTSIGWSPALFPNVRSFELSFVGFDECGPH